LDADGLLANYSIGLGGAVLCVVRLRLASRGASHSLAAGELRQRIFELAARAGVRIRGVTILMGSETRPPAAFATRWGGILLTDGLLKRLPFWNTARIPFVYACNASSDGVVTP
jgi:Zn-dependent protease with chaperone function